MNQLISGVPLVVVIMGLVEFCKKFDLAGRWLTLAAVLIGLVVGVAFQLAQAVPVNFAGWLAAVVFGLGLGLSAAGLNDWAGAQAEKAGTASVITRLQALPADPPKLP